MTKVITFLESIGLAFIGYMCLVLTGFVFALVEQVRAEGADIKSLFGSVVVLLLVASILLIPSCLIYYLQFLWS